MKWLFSIIAIYTLILTGCSEGDEEQDYLDQYQNNNEYYVKYQANSDGVSFLSSITVTTEKGTEIFTGRTRSWTQTFGPVGKGFNAKITAGSPSTTTVQIYVCKGEAPFAIKRSGNGSASYYIDF